MTPTEKLQQEAEQLYPYEDNNPKWNLIVSKERAAHVACAEKYIAMIEDLKQKHDEDRTKCIELVNTMHEYIGLLCAEIDELASIAMTHGWKSTRATIGAAFRQKIGQIMMQINKTPTP